MDVVHGVVIRNPQSPSKPVLDSGLGMGPPTRIEGSGGVASGTPGVGTPPADIPVLTAGIAGGRS